VQKDGKLLVDSSSVASIPVLAAKQLGAEMVVAIDIRSPIPQIEAARLKTALEAVLRLGVIASDKANCGQVEKADVVIRPKVGDVFWSDFRDLERLEAEGERTTREALPEIRKMLGK
jgi:NTE family protein